MNIDELTNLLDKEFINVYKNILINGSWGIGKTYFVKEYLKNKKNIIYTQLFGIDSIENLKLNIYMQINKITGFLKKANKELSGLNVSYLFASFSLPYFEGDINKSLTKKAQSKKLIIVIDDLERKSANIPMEELLGIIEEFSKIENTYIIIIANENEIGNINEDDRNTYFSFKEKIIEKTFNITSYSTDARRNIINNSLEKIANIDDKENTLCYIEEFLAKHKILNLRTIEKAMKFLEFIFQEIDTNEIKENEIKILIISVLAVVIEKTENLYYKETDTKKDKLSQMIMNDFIQRVVSNYFKELVISEKRIIVKIISDIYDDTEINDNFERLMNYFKGEHSSDDEDKNLFYKSKEDLELAIQDFYENSILKLNTFFDIDMWLKKFTEVNYYAGIINKNNWFGEEEIEMAINNYIENIPNIEKEKRNNTYRLYHLDQYIDDTTKRICSLVNRKISDKYIEDLVCKIKSEKTNNKYDEMNVINLFESNIEKNEIQKIVDILEENKYFLPNLNDNLTEKSWGFTHAIWRNMELKNQDRDKKFEKFVKNLLESSDDIGKYRIKSLNNQYHITIDE